MSEEKKYEEKYEKAESEEKECKCFCKSEGFRNFLTTTLGTFVGVYMALSLFSAIHKPPMPCQHGFMRPPMMESHFNNHKDFKKFHKNMKEFKKEIPEKNIPQAPDED